MAGQQTRGARSGKADTTLGPTHRDDLEARRARRDRDAPIERAYKAGYNGEDPAEFQTDDRLYQHYEDGAAARKDEDRQTQRQARVDQLRAGPVASASGMAGTGAGLVLGFVAFAMFNNYLDGGPAGVRRWLAAKFLNRTEPALAHPPTKPSTPTKPGTATQGPGE